MATSRDALLSSPRSGARPLGNSDPGAPAPAPGNSPPRRPSSSSPPRRSTSRSTTPGTRRPRSSSPASSPRPRSSRTAPADAGEAGRIPTTDLRAAELHGTGERPLRGRARQEAEAGGYQPPAAAAPPRWSFATEGAGALLALFAYPALVNLLRGGPTRMWGWFKAKWFNEPAGETGPSSGGPSVGQGHPPGGPRRTPPRRPAPRGRR